MLADKWEFRGRQEGDRARKDGPTAKAGASLRTKQPAEPEIWLEGGVAGGREA